MAAFWAHARRYYRRDGLPTTELGNFRRILRRLTALYVDVAVEDFGPSQLRALRQAMIDAGHVRRSINGQIKRARHVFAWGVAHEIVPPDVLAKLRAVAGRVAAPVWAMIEPLAL